MDTPQHHEKGQGPLHRLDFISPRLTPRIIRARSGRGTAIVQKLRLWLPVLAAIVVVLLFLWPIIRPTFIMKDIVKNIPDLVIDNLHYKGLDDKNQPYSIAATQATKPSGLQNIYDLIKPSGEITLQNGVWLSGNADYGRYDSEGKKLWLGGNIHLFHDKGYEFVTDEAQVNLNNDDAWGDKPALLQGDFGTIRGQGFRFLDGGKVIVFQGPATAVLSLHSGGASDKPSEAIPAPAASP